jgi:hypothetical protein
MVELNNVAIGRDVISISASPRCRSNSRKSTLRWNASTAYSGQLAIKLLAVAGERLGNSTPFTPPDERMGKVSDEVAADMTFCPSGDMQRRRDALYSTLKR